MSQKGKGDMGGMSTTRVDSGIVIDDDGEIVTSRDDDDLDDDDMNFPRVYSLKLIDFAHAQWTPGQGPDENNLKGVRSLIRIFDELSR
jgi:1D-myo-inositol-tetrakisphosphate 5-kinase/inositol-polyphosphate multikinase